MQVGFETEGTAIYDTMQFVKNEVSHFLLDTTPNKSVMVYCSFAAYSEESHKAYELLRMQINTVGVGVAIGQACMLLSAGTKGKRFMLPHATGVLVARPLCGSDSHPPPAFCLCRGPLVQMK